MERRRNGIDGQPPRRHREYPSFSSSLLDAIYRSIDEADTRGAADRAPPQKKQNPPSFPECRRSAPPATTLPRRRLTTSSSSDASSYGGFSSSDTESASTPRLRPVRTAPAVRSGRFGPGDGCPDRSVSEEKRAKKERHGSSIRSRLRDLRDGRAAPSSPGARIAGFIGSLFGAKSKGSAESGCAARSCLSKTPSAGRRTVRFCPVSVIVGEDCGRPCAEKWVCGGGGRREKAEEEEEEEEEEDLFELKNLAVVGRFRDELPVYETTRLGRYGGVSRCCEENGRRLKMAG